MHTAIRAHAHAASRVTERRPQLSCTRRSVLMHTQPQGSPTGSLSSHAHGHRCSCTRSLKGHRQAASALMHTVIHAHAHAASRVTERRPQLSCTRRSVLMHTAIGAHAHAASRVTNRLPQLSCTRPSVLMHTQPQGSPTGGLSSHAHGDPCSCTRSLKG